MSTRTILTSQPVLACEVCERRLLRGEQPEVFIVAGERRTVCELCAPRAASEGWLRESQEPPESPSPVRTRRRRTLFGRWRRGEAAASAEPAAPAAAQPARGDEPAGGAGPAARGGRVGHDERPRSSRDLGRERRADRPPAPGPLKPGELPLPESSQTGEPPGPGALEPRGEVAAAAGSVRADERLQRAVELFNAAEYPRRVSSLARSLGTPRVSVRADEDLPGRVAIVVAWDLCWYRYEIDIDDEAPAMLAVVQGNDLSELARDELIANARADERGRLALSGAA